MKTLKLTRFVFPLVITLFLSFADTPVLAVDLESLLPEFAGRGNMMGGAEVCKLKDRNTFRKQSMRLIKESGLTAADQNELKRTFVIEKEAAVEFYTKYGDADNCDVLASDITPMSEDDIQLWIRMSR